MGGRLARSVGGVAIPVTNVRYDGGAFGAAAIFLSTNFAVPIAPPAEIVYCASRGLISDEGVAEIGIFFRQV